MDGLPSSIMLDILSRIPSVKELFSFQCVSKQWGEFIEDRHLAIFHGEREHTERPIDAATPIFCHQISKQTQITFCFHIIDEPKQDGSANHVLKPKKYPDFKFLYDKSTLSKDEATRVQLLGHCNGLLYILQDDHQAINSLVAIHPMKKQRYELPAFPLPFDGTMYRESCGLGFDSSTDTFKMVCVFLKAKSPPKKPDLVRENLCTMVHVFGTNSWQVIPQVPCCPIAGKAVFANGCLFWLTSFTDRAQNDGGRDVIWFDMKTNEFGLISRPITICGHPKRRQSCFYDHLVDLNGQVGFVCIRTMEIWLLNHEKEWLLHCRINNHDELPEGYIDIIGYLNKEQDILIKVVRSTITPTCGASKAFFVYSLKSGVLREVKIIGRETQCRATADIIMYPKSLFSIHDINTDFHRIKKTHSQSCGFLSS